MQHENKMLKLQQAENQDEQGQLLQSMLDDANARKNELESENRYDSSFELGNFVRLFFLFHRDMCKAFCKLVNDSNCDLFMCLI